MTEQLVTQWIVHYGYFAVFFLLIFGIIWLPIPDEWLLVLAGYLVFRDILAFAPTVLVAGLGSICGLTASYFFGRTSTNLVLAVMDAGSPSAKRASSVRNTGSKTWADGP